MISIYLYLFLSDGSWPFFMFLLSAMVHLPFSLGYHLFMPINKSVFETWRRLDLTFIFIASCPLTLALCYYAVPWPVTCILTGIMCLVSCIFVLFKKNIKQSTNALFITIAVACYTFPMIASAFLGKTSFWYPIATLGSLLVSGLLYTNCWPERFFTPGTLDLFGRSHHFVHILIGLAHVIEFIFIKDAMNYK